MVVLTGLHARSGGPKAASSTSATKPGGRAKRPLRAEDFPNRLGPLKKTDVSSFSDPRLGYGVRYVSGEGMRTDVYVYDLGVGERLRKNSAPLVRQHFKQVKGDVFRHGHGGGEYEVEHVCDDRSTFGRGKSRYPASLCSCWVTSIHCRLRPPTSMRST